MKPYSRQFILSSSLASLLLLLSCNSSNTSFESESVQANNGVGNQKIVLNNWLLGDWTGDSTIWRLENNVLVGSTMEKVLETSAWITTTTQFADFELRLEVKLIGDVNKNSGVYYRGQWDEEYVVGYEFDIGGWGADGEIFWGELHDPYRRADLVEGLSRSAIDTIYKEETWNEVKIRAVGNHIQHWLNGHETVSWHEDNREMQKTGFIAFQMHSESKAKVFFKNIQLTPIE